KCPECHCTFTTNVELRKHLKCHSDVRLFTCATCRSTYELQSKLMKHLEKNRYHNNNVKEQIKCSECDYACTSNARLQNHLKRHNKVKQFSCCTECNYTCTSNARLQYHLKCHNKVKQFSCVTCKLEYKLQSGLARH
ncbi:hypothetical protein HELRODRAFT_133671, partial [Helobdella robusta]|uniref:C2H2-type domain-containing protein n=1 Tax=Helobdella robusta TaxID=6412 RepID=T1EI23_HELRO